MYIIKYNYLGDILSIYIALLLSTLAGLSTVIGSFFILIKINNNSISKFITFCLSFSIAIMIGICIADLIPLAIINIIKHNTLIYYLLIPFSFCIGIFLIIIINKKINYNNSLYKIGILSMLALIIHNFPEGIATFMSSIKDSTLGIKLTIAIMLHNIPEGIAIAVPIYYSTQSKLKAFIATLLSGLSEPMGALLSYLFLYKYINNIVLDLLLVLVAGMMMSLSINEIYPEVLSYKQFKYIKYGFIIGIIIIIINHFWI